MVLTRAELGKAIAYALNHEEMTFKNILLDGKLVLSNYYAERAIQMLVIERKTGYFHKALKMHNRQPLS